MRTCTITLSIVVHAIAVCVAILAPLLASDELPAPRTATEFIQVVALPDPPAPTPAQKPVVRVGGSIKPPQKVADVAPIYPPIARAAHVDGLVILEAVIAEDGSVRDVHVLRSKPLLDAAAVEAARQWRFTPTLLNGEPVPVVMTITVAFQLR